MAVHKLTSWSSWTDKENKLSQDKKFRLLPGFAKNKLQQVFTLVQKKPEYEGDTEVIVHAFNGLYPWEMRLSGKGIAALRKAGYKVVYKQQFDMSNLQAMMSKFDSRSSMTKEFL